ncbi:MAG: VOC family protein [Sphingomonas sp.]|uniref:VOC family protein n=1 Tax=Sphingomonas sp. TaxID=28214 RepID=UPI0025EC95E5|nr:VOC family protein [Sphingomonas sp.]MBY0284731.1 VOC family protein [Sphingomonas sp.]
MKIGLATLVAMALFAAMAPAQAREKTMSANPIAYVEIPVTDMDRAIAFYADVLGFDFERQTIDGYDMALFPAAEGAAGASGALVKGDVYVPGKTGPIVYFRVADIDAVLKRARARGAKILYDKKDVGAFGFVAEVEDSEGNRIALSAPK